jgi:predicted amidohydrolase
MRIGLYQFSPEFGQVEKNISKIETALEGCEADLIILPELCTTGYQLLSREEAVEYAEEIPGGQAVERLSSLCRQGGFQLVAGIAEKTGGRVYNAAVLIGPDGWMGTYRKVHLFNVEKTLFDPGDTGFQVWNAAGACIGIMICFDWVFPESARSLAMKGADLICHPSNLVLPWCQDAMITRSIENRVFTATANRVGTEARWEEALTFTGRSQITSPSGERLMAMGVDEELLSMVEVDLASARDKMIAPRNHVLEDRRTDKYNS